MRTIEFRCWNAFSRVMQSWEDMVKLNKIHLLAEQNPSYPVMQFTGVLDKNGVKIFEGDTVSFLYKYKCGAGEPSRMSGEVFISPVDGVCLGSVSYRYCGDISVIGNIHEA